MEYIRLVKTEIFNLTNEVRLRSMLRPVYHSSSLEMMGQIHTNEMYTHNFFLHDNPHTKVVASLEDRIIHCRIKHKYSMVGENLADYPVIESANKLCWNIIKGWLNSPGHRANLLNGNYDSVGFGVLLYPKSIHNHKINYLLVTQNFGKTF